MWLESWISILKCPARALNQFPSGTSRSINTGVPDFDHYTRDTTIREINIGRNLCGWSLEITHYMALWGLEYTLMVLRIQVFGFLRWVAGLCMSDVSSRSPWLLKTKAVRSVKTSGISDPAIQRNNTEDLCSASCQAYNVSCVANVCARNVTHS